MLDSELIIQEGGPGSGKHHNKPGRRGRHSLKPEQPEPASPPPETLIKPESFDFSECERYLNKPEFRKKRRDYLLWLYSPEGHKFDREIGQAFIDWFGGNE